MRNLIYIAMEKTTILKFFFITNHLFGHLSIAMLNNWRVLDGDITDMTNNDGNQWGLPWFTLDLRIALTRKINGKIHGKI